MKYSAGILKMDESWMKRRVSVHTISLPQTSVAGYDECTPKIDNCFVYGV